MRYPTKVDAWIAALLLIAPFSLIFGTIVSGLWYVPLVGIAFIGLLSLVLWPCEYILESDKLVVRSGLIRWRVPYREITEIKPTTNPLSSPAWSLDRLWIQYGKRAVMVSPKEKEKFAMDLGARAGLRKVGQRWLRP